jgi:Nif-specific regulatory protein
MNTPDSIAEWDDLSLVTRRRALRSGRRTIAITSQTGPEVKAEWFELTGSANSFLHVPPLRERREDIPLLAGRFLEDLTLETGFPTPELSATAVEALTRYPWPGNARELREAVSQAMDRSDAARVSVGDLPPAVRGALGKPAEPSFPERLVALEYEALKEELSRQRGNMTRTAQALGLTPRQVSWRLRKYGIDPRSYKRPPRSGG